MTGTDENRHSRAHVDIVLIALVFGLSLFGIVAVCVATFSPGSDPDDCEFAVEHTTDKHSDG